MSHPPSPGSGPAREAHAVFMGRAIELAREAGIRDEVPVGAVIVDPVGEIVGEGSNRTRELADPTAHAEILALREAGRRLGDWRLESHTLYVTLEPCAMCAGASVLGRIRTLVFGARDPKAGMCGSLDNLVADERLNHRIEVVEGVCAGECGALLTDFFRARRG